MTCSEFSRNSFFLTALCEISQRPYSDFLGEKYLALPYEILTKLSV